MTTFIARAEVYDQPMGCECDLDALVAGVTIPNLIQITLDAMTAARHYAFRVPVLRSDVARNLLPLNLPADSCACTHVGAGFTAPVSGLAIAPGAPNETRNE